MHSAEQPPEVPGLVLGDVLGRGAGGPVWSAVDSAGERRAVKVVPVPRHGLLGAEEARLEVAAASFEHEHVVRVHDVVGCTVDGQAALALVMERLDGGSLGRVVAERGRLSAGEVVTVIAPIASALAALHARGIVHGDVSPGNVLLAANGKPALADLGVARVVGDARSEVAGTDGVLAPEVELGALPSPASDVHALGALAWWCLTGAAPGSALVRRPLVEQVPGVPGALVAVVEAAASPGPEDRPTALELAAAVFDAAAAEPLRITPGGTEATALTRRIRAAHRPVASEDDSAGGSSRRDRATRSSSPGRVLGPARAVGGPLMRGLSALSRLPHVPRPGVAWAPVGVAGAAVLLTVLALVGIATGLLPTPERAGAAPVARGVATTSSPDGRTGRPPAVSPSSPPPSTTGAGVPVRSPAPATVAAPTSPAVPPRASPRATDPHATPPRVTTPRAVTPRSLAPLLDQPDAPTRDPRGVAAALLSGRARLWNAPDLTASLRPAALAAVHAFGSSSRADDVRMLTEAARGGFRYEGVGFTVRTARATGAGDRAVISATVDASAYVVRGADGATDRRAARGDRPVRLVVTRTPAGWRLAELTVIR